jgi:hypothetical protein
VNDGAGSNTRASCMTDWMFDIAFPPRRDGLFWLKSTSSEG